MVDGQNSFPLFIDAAAREGEIKPRRNRYDDRGGGRLHGFVDGSPNSHLYPATASSPGTGHLPKLVGCGL
jgi:hypothetical protein